MLLCGTVGLRKTLCWVVQVMRVVPQRLPILYTRGCKTVSQVVPLLRSDNNRWLCGCYLRGERSLQAVHQKQAPLTWHQHGA